MSPKNLYATLIGINNYPQNPLGGCVRDALAMDRFLRDICQQQPEAQIHYHPLYLLGYGADDAMSLQRHADKFPDFSLANLKSPTFQMVSNTAFEHLRQAKDGDICLFYYSGHGSTIQAPEEFRGSKSKLQNETIVCVDSRTDARDLIDKEIAFLLWDALQGKDVHCVVIMDCCFAGNNTRAIEGDTGIRYRHAADSNRQIPLKEYLGFHQGFYQPQPDGGMKISVAKYVQLAASMDNQTAQETASDGGLFTSQLLEVLRKGGSTRTYRDLMQTTRISVRNRNPKQTPVDFAADDKDLDQPFLGGDIMPYRPAFEIRYDGILKNWKLFGGQMDGLISTPGNPSKVKVQGSDKEFSLHKVESNYSILDTSALSELDKTKTYQGRISKFSAPCLQVCLSEGAWEFEKKAKGRGEETLQSVFGSGSKFPYVHINFEENHKEAPYQIRISEADEFVLVRTGSTVPLFKRNSHIASFLSDVDFMGKWLVACELKQSQTNFRSEDFVFRLERIENQPFNWDDPDHMDADWVNPDGVLPEVTTFSYRNGYNPAFRLSVSIHPDSKISSCYVGALYLDSRYGITSNLIRPDAGHLTKGGAPVFLRYFDGDGNEFKSIKLGLHKDYQKYHINEITSVIKLMVSNEPLHLDVYAQEALQLDDAPDIKYRSAIPQTTDKDMDMDRSKDDAPDRTDWCVFTTRLRIIGPKKSKVLEPGIPVDFGAFQVEAPTGFSATAFAATGDDISEKVFETKRSKSGASLNVIAPPSGLFGNALTLDQAFPAGISGAANNTVQVLELKSAEPGVKLNLPEGKILKINTKHNLNSSSVALETIFPFGYDEKSDLYYPIGYTNGAGVICIEQLPDETDLVLERDEQHKQRSLGGSIKLFFQKVAWSRLSGQHEYNRLSLHRRGPDGSLVEIAYFGNERSRAQASEITAAINGGEALLFVHGIIGDTTDMVKAVFEKEALTLPDTAILTYDYENLNSGIAAAAQNLKIMLTDCGFGETKRLTILCHSMGGLVSRYMIEHLEGDRFVKKLIQCGTPNGGSELSDFRKKVTGWLVAGINGVAIFQPYLAVAAFLGRRLEKGLFNNLDEMDPESSFLAKLNEPGKKQPDVPYYLVGGDTGQIEVQFPEDASFFRKMLENLKSRGVYVGLDNVVFDKAPNDMAVKVERMQHLPWGTHESTKILPCDHISYFINTQSLEEIQKFLA